MMKSEGRGLRLVWLVMFLVLPTIARASDILISKVSVQGNERIESGTVLLQVASKAGEPYSKQTLDNDIKQVYRTGYFDQVLGRLERDGSKIQVIIFVKERAAIRNVQLEGNEEVSDDTLKEKLSLGARRFLDRAKIRAGIEQARQHYQSLGYYDAEITVDEAQAEENQVDLTFKISEGKKKKIRELVFEGNKEVSADDLEDAIKTSEYFWLTSWLTGSGVVKKEQIEQDAKELVRFYLNKGFVDARVPVPDVEETEEGLRVTFKITEGPVYSYGAIHAAGTFVDNSEEKTLEGIESKAGETFSAEKLRKDTFTISEKFTDRGYAFTNVNPDTVINRENKTVGVNFQVERGALITVDRINITGNKKTADNVIRRSLQVQEQQLYSSSKIRKSQELLQRTGYFEESTITPEASSDPGKVDLNVAVREGNTGTFSVGAGVSSGDGFIFSTQISENNLFGSGNSVTLDVNSGSRRENYVLSFNNPRINDTYLSGGADVLSTLRDFDFFERKQTGGSLTLGYPLWFLGSEYLEDIRGSLSYELTRVDIRNVEDIAPQQVKDQTGETTASSITPRLIRNTINNPMDPTGGSRQSLGVEIAGLGGDQKFWLLQASNTVYVDLFETGFGPLVFSQRTRVDYGETFGDDPFPLYKRFFPGGINSVRGYDAREMGPRDLNGREYGGSKELIANFDLIFPIVSSIGLRGVVFYDAGDAFDDSDPIKIGDLRQAIGWGFRWKSPIAPIRIEIGYPLDKAEGDKSMVTNFSFGNPM